MGVQLNIKDERTVELARTLAAALGTSVTETVRQALQEKKLRQEESIATKVGEIMTTLKGSRELWGPETAGKTSKEIMDSIYDENGLPA